jgi:hypothetical protein
MKKITAILAGVLLVCGAANAQSLGSILSSVASAASETEDGNSKTSSILNTLSSVIYSYTGTTDAVSLPGTWTYYKPAMALKSSSTLGTLAGSAASESMENKVQDYFDKVGLKSGSMTFTFNEDLTFTCTVKGIPLEGTWSTQSDASKVTLKFGKTLSYLSMTGALSSTTNGCQMLFDGKRFLSFIKAAANAVSKASSAASLVSSLSGNYSDMQIGFELKKSN